MSLLNTTAGKPRLPIQWLPTSPVEWLLETVALGILLFWLFYLATNWNGLPDSVPSGFSFAGRPRGSASKSMLWLLPGLGILIYVSLTLLSRFPHIHNLPVEVTATNAAKVYNCSRWVVQLMKLELAASFGYIEWKMLQTGHGNADGLHPWFLPALLVVVSATSLYPLIRMQQFKEG